MYDLIIRGGTVIDGSGEGRFAADVADGKVARIAAPGELDGDAKQIIDAQGKLVTPGWVDIHTHYDGQATWDPILAPSSWHGVTTVVMGNCGVGFAPVKPQDREFLIELMEGVEDIPGAALSEGIDWQWESFPEYLDALEKFPRAIDVATQVPHGAVRAYVMGERCNTDYAPTKPEVDAMAALVREGVEAGALGFSSSKTLLHKDIKGEYMPGTFSGNEEMLALGLGMKGLNNSVFELVSDHLGEEEEWAWVTEFQKQTGLTVTLIATTAPAYENNMMYNLAEQARQEGREIRPQAAGRPTGVLHGLQSSFHAFVGHPTWRAELSCCQRSRRSSRARCKICPSSWGWSFPSVKIPTMSRAPKTAWRASHRRAAWIPWRSCTTCWLPTTAKSCSTSRLAATRATRWTGRRPFWNTPTYCSV
jgi:N-acyl-D-aspartate/D-glutamate deacylase